MISIPFLAYVIFVAVVLLACTYGLLAFVSKKYRGNIGHKNDSIKVIATKYIPQIGNVCVLSVNNAQYIVVNSNNGLALSQVHTVEQTAEPSIKE